MNELVVFGSERAAARAGFKGQIWPGHEHIRAWWPALGQRPLYGRALQRVTISSEAEDYISSDDLAVMKMRTASHRNPIIMQF